MMTFRWVLIIVSAVCLLAATFGMQAGSVNLLAAGLFAWLIADHVTVKVAS